MEKSIFAMGLVLIILLTLPLENAEAFQTKNLQNSSVSIKAHLVSDGTSLYENKGFHNKRYSFQYQQHKT